MDPVLDRVRTANPASEHEFSGLANLAALELKPRKRRRWLAVPALGAILAGVVVLPSSAPQAKEILKRANEAVAVDGGILYARSHAQIGPTGGAPTWSGGRQVWVRGTEQMRWLDDNGSEEVFAAGDGTTRRGPKGKVTHARDVTMVPNEIFRAGGLLKEAQGDSNVELVGEESVNGHDTYVLRWEEPTEGMSTQQLKIEMTMWVDKATYAPVRFTSHDTAPDTPPQPDGTDPDKPLDQTYIENIDDFKVLPDTPENRRLLELQ